MLSVWVKEREVPLNRSHGIVVSLNWAVRPCGPVFVTFEEDLKEKGGELTLFSVDRRWLQNSGASTKASIKVESSKENQLHLTRLLDPSRIEFWIKNLQAKSTRRRGRTPTAARAWSTTPAEGRKACPGRPERRAALRGGPSGPRRRHARERAGRASGVTGGPGGGVGSVEDT